MSVLVLLSLFLAVSDTTRLLDPPKALVQSITGPIQLGLYQIANDARRQLGFVFLARRASQEKAALEQQLAQVLSENAQLRKKMSELQAFSAQRDALSPSNFNLLPARPLGLATYLYIDRGETDGVKVGQVVVFRDTMLGRVVSAGPKKSAVQLLTDPNSHLAAFSQSSDGGKARGVLSGQFESEMLLDKILHQEPVMVGDLVYSEGSEVDIPRGLVLGTVSQVVNQDNQLFKQAKVRPVFDVTNLDLVFVVIN